MKEFSKNPQKILKLPVAWAEGRFYDFGPFRLDVRERVLLRDGQPLALTPKTFETLLLLVRNHGHLLTKEELMAALWGETVVEESNLSQNIFVLRKALGESADEHRYIETVPRVGYRFVASVTESDKPDASLTRRDAARAPAELKSDDEPLGDAEAHAVVVPAETTLPGSSRTRFILPGVLVIGVLVATGLWWWIGRSRPATVEPPTFHRLTYSGRDYSPAASADGRALAYASDRDGRPRIWLKQLAGGGESALTAGPDDRPRFSPDGSTVLFSRDEGAHRSLYRTAVLGGEPRRIVEDATDGDWSPDGHQIVFIQFRKQNTVNWSSIALASADGAGAHELVRVQGNLDSPRWSPDGRTIAARQAGASTGILDSILLVKPEGKGRRSIAPPGPAGRISSLAWSGTGDEILYAESESLTSTRASVSTRVVRLSVETGRAQTAFWVPESIHSIDILGPGRLVFDAHSTLENLQEIPLTRIATAPEDRWLTRGQSNDRQPAYSPDGEWVVFSSDKTRNLDLWKVSTKTGAVQRLTDDAADDWDPAFTRDGKKLIWSSNRSGPFEIWIAKADGSGARQLTHDGVDAENPTATADGQWIIYSSADPAKAGIWKIRSDGSGATRLTTGPAVWPEVSPDGRFAVYRNAPYDWPNSRMTHISVRVVRISDGTVLPFEIRTKEGLSAGRSRWTPDARAIAFVGPDEKGVNGVFVQDFLPGRDTTATRRPLAGFDPNRMTESFGISPDGSRITIAGGERLSSLIIADHVPGVSTRK